MYLHRYLARSLGTYCLGHLPSYTHRYLPKYYTLGTYIDTWDVLWCLLFVERGGALRAVQKYCLVVRPRHLSCSGLFHKNVLKMGLVVVLVWLGSKVLK